MIKENVSVSEADKLVEQGGRVLYRRTIGGEQVCDVEMPDKPEKAKEAEPKAKEPVATTEEV